MLEMKSAIIRKVQTRLKYREVADAIWMMLRRGGFEAGQRVPSEMGLAERFGVSYMTIRKANEDLIRRGIIQRRQSRGTFVTCLAGQRPGVKTVGFLAVGRDLEGPTLRYYQLVKDHFSDKGVDLLFDSVVPFLDAHLIPPLFMRNSVDAIIAYGMLDEWLLRHLAQQPIPVLASGSASRVPSIPMVQANDELLAYRTTRTLLNDLDYRHVWLMIEPLHLHISRQAMTGYRRAIAESGQAMERIVMCEEGNYESFVRNFRGGLRMLEGSHAVIWWTRCPFVDLKHLDVAGRRLGVVNSPRREGEWRLPAEIDLGCLAYPWKLLVQQTAIALDELISNGKGWSIDLVPEIHVVGTDGQPCLEARWTASTVMD